MKRNNTGFTLIELIVVIVILGILAATALPKFINISDDAKLSAMKGVAGGAASAMSMNYAGCQVTNNVVTANKCVKVSNCTDAASLLQGGLPTGYTITALALGTGTSNGDVGTCTLNLAGYTPSTPVTFTGMSAGN